jgi:hypothetical protein
MLTPRLVVSFWKIKERASCVCGGWEWIKEGRVDDRYLPRRERGSEREGGREQ